jgi:hypothetical protein
MDTSQQVVSRDAAAVSGRTNPAAALDGPVRIESDGYYSEHEAARMFGMKPDTLRRRRQTRSDLPFCRFGKRVFYRGADIIAALEASRRTSTSASPGAR